MQIRLHSFSVINYIGISFEIIIACQGKKYKKVIVKFKQSMTDTSFGGTIQGGKKRYSERDTTMAVGTYSIVSGICLLTVFVLYIRIMSGVERSKKRDLYVDIMIIGMIYLALDMLWGVIYDDLLPIPVAIQKFIYAGYYASSSILTYRWFVYVEFMQDSVFHNNPIVKQLVKLPTIFVVAVSFLSIWTGTFFSITADGTYVRGSWYPIQLALTYGYLIFSAAKVAFRMLSTRDFEKQNTYLIMLSYFIFPVVFGILQIVNQDMPYLCIGIALATFQTYLFHVNFEMERERSIRKIHSLSRLFISTYYLNLQTGRREYLSNEMEMHMSYLTGEFYKTAPQDYEESIHVYTETYVHAEDKELYRTMCDREYMKKHLSPDKLFYLFNYRQVVDGVEKWYRMHIIAASFTPQEEVSRVVMAVMDVDTQVRKNISQKAAIEEALIQAENANRSKSAFLSNMSHDIRTPMNAIIGFTNLAQSHIGEQDVVKGYLEKIHSASGHLLSLINDILDMSRIESGKIQIEEDETAISDIIRDVQNMIQPMAEEAKQEFIIETNIVNNFVYTDKLRIKQILINLLGNAIKFTPEGGKIWLKIQQEPIAPEGYGVYVFKVRDTGVGIAPEFQDKVFQAFEREKTSTVSGIQGTGLGLAITKSIVEMAGGKISVTSEVNEGTEFVVKIVFLLQDVEENYMSGQELEQMRIQEEDLKNKQRKELFAGRRVLLVEDNDLNREIARALLADEGLIVEEAVNGQIAFDKVRQSNPGDYDLILMDIQMPIMNGYEATKQIRSLSNKFLANTPIVAMTANAFEDEKKRALSCGMNGHIAKPIDVTVLFETIKQIIKSNQ